MIENDSILADRHHHIRLPPFRVHELTVKHLEMLREDFDRTTEADGSNELDVHAFADMLQRHFTITTDAAHEIFSECDASNNGGLDWDEISTFLLFYKQPEENRGTGDDDDEEEDEEEDDDDERDGSESGGAAGGGARSASSPASSSSGNGRSRKRRARKQPKLTKSIRNHDRVTEIKLLKDTKFRMCDPTESGFAPTSNYQHSEMITRLVCHPIVGKMFSSSRDGTVRSWDTDSYELISVVHNAAGRAWINDMALCHHGRRFCAVGSDRTVSLYDCRTEAFWKGFVGVPTMSSSGNSTNNQSSNQHHNNNNNNSNNNAAVDNRNVLSPPGLFHPVARNEIDFSRKRRTRTFRQEQNRMEQELLAQRSKGAKLGVATPSFGPLSARGGGGAAAAAPAGAAFATLSGAPSGPPSVGVAEAHRQEMSSSAAKCRPLEVEYIILKQLKCAAMAVAACERSDRDGPMLLGLENGSVQAYALEEPNVLRNALDCTHHWEALHPRAFVTSLAYDSNLDCAFSAGSDGAIYHLPLHESRKSKIELTARAARDNPHSLHAIYRIQALADYRLLMSCGSERVVKLWSPTSGLMPPIVLEASGSGVIVDAAHMPGEPLVVTLDSDKTIRLWDIRTQRQINAWHDSENYRPSNALSVIACDVKRQRVITAQTAPVVHNLTRALVPFPYSFYKGHQKPLVRVLRCPASSQSALPSSNSVKAAGGGGGGGAVAGPASFSSQVTNRFVTADEECIKVWNFDGTLHATWTTQSLRGTAVVSTSLSQAPAGPITSIAFDSSGRRLIVLTANGLCFIVSFNNGLLLRELSANKQSAEANRFHQPQRENSNASVGGGGGGGGAFSPSEHLQLESIECSGERYIACIVDNFLVLWNDSADGIADGKAADHKFNISITHAEYRMLQPLDRATGLPLTREQRAQELRTWRNTMPTCLCSCPPLYIAVGTDAGVVVLYMLVPRFHIFRILGDIERTTTVYALEYSSRYDLLFAAMSDGRLCVWSLANRNIAWVLDHREPLARGRAPSLRCVSVLDRYIATSDSEGYVYFWAIFDEVNDETSSDDEGDEKDPDEDPDDPLAIFKRKMASNAAISNNSNNMQQPTTSVSFGNVSSLAAEARRKRSIANINSKKDNNSDNENDTDAAAAAMKKQQRRPTIAFTAASKTTLFTQSKNLRRSIKLRRRRETVAGGGAGSASSIDYDTSTNFFASNEEEDGAAAATRVFLPSTCHVHPEVTFLGGFRAHNDECVGVTLFYNLEARYRGTINPRFVDNLPPRTLFAVTASSDCQSRMFDVFTGAYVGFCGSKAAFDPHGSRRRFMMNRRQLRRKSLAPGGDVVAEAALMFWRASQTGGDLFASSSSQSEEDQDQNENDNTEENNAEPVGSSEGEDGVALGAASYASFSNIQQLVIPPENENQNSNAADQKEKQDDKNREEDYDEDLEDVAAIAAERVGTLTNSEITLAPLDKANSGVDYYGLLSHALATLTKEACQMRMPLQASAVFDPVAAAGATPGAVLASGSNAAAPLHFASIVAGEVDSNAGNSRPGSSGRGSSSSATADNSEGAFFSQKPLREQQNYFHKKREQNIYTLAPQKSFRPSPSMVIPPLISPGGPTPLNAERLHHQQNHQQQQQQQQHQRTPRQQNQNQQQNQQPSSSAAFRAKNIRSLRTRMHHAPRVVQASSSSAVANLTDAERAALGETLDKQLPGTFVVAGGDSGRAAASAMVKKEILLGLRDELDYYDLGGMSMTLADPRAAMMAMSTIGGRGGGGSVAQSPSARSRRGGAGGAAAGGLSMVSFVNASNDIPPSPATTARTLNAMPASPVASGVSDDVEELLRSVRIDNDNLPSSSPSAAAAVPIKPTGSPQQQALSLPPIFSPRQQNQNQRQTQQQPSIDDDDPPLHSFLPALPAAPQQTVQTARTTRSTLSRNQLSPASLSARPTVAPPLKRSTAASSRSPPFFSSSSSTSHQQQKQKNQPQNQPQLLKLGDIDNYSELPAIDISRLGLRTLYAESRAGGGAASSFSSAATPTSTTAPQTSRLSRQQQHQLSAMGTLNHHQQHHQHDERDQQASSATPSGDLEFTQQEEESFADIYSRLNEYRLDKQIAKLITITSSAERQAERSRNQGSSQKQNQNQQRSSSQQQNQTHNNNNNNNTSSGDQTYDNPHQIRTDDEQQQQQQQSDENNGSSYRRLAAWLPPLERDLIGERHTQLRNAQLLGIRSKGGDGGKGRHELIEEELAKIKAANAALTEKRRQVRRKNELETARARSKNSIDRINARRK